MNAEPLMRLIDVGKRFGSQEILKGVNLSIYEGKTTVIVGESGKGKSLILKHMLGLVTPDKGEVLVEGKNINKVGRRELKNIRAMRSPFLTPKRVKVLASRLTR